MNMSTTAVLLSGGIDSAACLAFYVACEHDVTALFIDYMHKSRHKESAAASAIARAFRVPLTHIACDGLRRDIPGITRGRNLFLLSTGLSAFPDDSGILAIGIHKGTGYRDCSSEFINSMQSVFDVCSQGAIQIGAPFLEWTKADIWDYCRRSDVPVELTYSCELGLPQPCGDCLSCGDLELLNESSK